MKALEGADLEEIKKKFIENVKAYYYDQANKDPSKERFLKGWNNRLDKFL